MLKFLLAIALLLIPLELSVINYQPDWQKWKVVYAIADRFKRSPDTVSQIYDATKAAASHYQLDHSLPMAIVAVESGFNPFAKSHDGAEGVMQTLKASGVHPIEPQDIEQSVYAGSGLFYAYYKQLGSLQAAVKAYNIGITNYVRGKHHKAGKKYLAKVEKELTYMASIM